MRSNLFLLVVVILPSMFLTSCLSGYMPVDHDKEHTGQAIAKIQLQGCTIRILIEKQSIGNISVTLAALGVSKAAPIKLSNVKISLAGMPGTYILEHIDFRHTARSGQSSLLKTNTSPIITKGSDFDLSEDGRYIITYYFSAAKTPHYPKKLTAEIAISLSAATGTQDFHQSIVFRKYHNLSLFH